MENNNIFAPATDAQINALKKMGYTGETEGLTMGEASDLISEINKKRYSNQSNNYNTGNNNPQYGSVANNQFANNPQPSAAPQRFGGNEVAAIKDLGIADDLMNNLNEMATDGMLYIPDNYSVGNALKSAMSKILTSEQCDKLLQCTADSKKQALTEYVVQGLDASKNQAYFIPYGNKMTMMRSYFGDVAVVKRTGLVKDVYAIVIYDGDEIEIGFDDYGRETLLKHTTSFKNKDNQIVGAYAVAIGVNDYKAYCFMTRKELEASWKMSKAPNGKLLTDYKQEAAKRTVIRRLVKMLFNSSLNTTEEQTALIGSYNRTTEDEYEDNVINAEVKNQTTEEVKTEQKKKNASKKVTPEAEEWLDEEND